MPCPGQGIAAIVVARCTVVLGEGIGGGVTFAGAVPGAAARGGGVEVAGGGLGVALLPEAGALLIGAQPQRRPVQGLGWCGRQPQQGQQPQPAASKAGGGKGQQQRRQPGRAGDPLTGRAGLRGAAGAAARQGGAGAGVQGEAAGGVA